MNDRDLDRLLADSSPAGPAAREQGARARQAILDDLAPVRPLMSARTAATALAAVGIIVIVIGAYGLGVRGWQRMSAAQGFPLIGWALAGVVFASVSIGSRMAPGRPVRPWSEALWGAAFVALAVAAAALMEFHPGPKMVLGHCIGVVLATALVWGAGAAVLLRRSWPAAPARFGLACGAAAGLTGFVVVQVFCPYLEAAHILISHVLPALAACALGAGLGVRFAR